MVAKARQTTQERLLGLSERAREGVGRGSNGEEERGSRGEDTPVLARGLERGTDNGNEEGQPREWKCSARAHTGRQSRPSPRALGERGRIQGQNRIHLSQRSVK